MTFDPMIITWDMLGLIGDYCGKIHKVKNVIFNIIRLNVFNGSVAL